MSHFAKDTTFTVMANLLTLALGLGTSVILARSLGPEGKGIYTLSMLLPALIVTFGNLGIGTATVYYVAKQEFSRQVVLGNNVFLSLGIGTLGVLAGLIVVVFFRDIIFPGVALVYLLLALALVPIQIFFSYTRYILLGVQQIKQFNYAEIAQSALFLGCISITLLGLKAGVTGALLAGLLTWFIVDALVFRWAKAIAGGIDFTPNASYVRRAATYGLLAHLASILGFLNYRVDMFLINGFLGPTAVGLYSVAVGMVEKLWLVSSAASTVLFPRVAAESKEHRRREFTPLVARTVLWMTVLGVSVLVLLSHWIVLFLYSEAFLPAVSALQVLVVGIVALSVWRLLANDIAGRGFPGLNIYIGVASATTNVALNILWIPRYGIVGAAWASTVSYTVSFLGALFFYCRLSGNRWTVVVFPQKGDWALYWRTARALGQWANGKLRGVFR